MELRIIPRISSVSQAKHNTLFCPNSSSDSELDIDNLIAKTEKEGDEETAPKEGAAFSFAKIWTADKDELEEVADDDQFEVDSWAQTLQKINDERAKKQAQEEEESGRGSRRNVRRKAAAAINVGLYFCSLFFR